VATKVLVTGASGNVGSWVVQELRGRGVSIRAFVRDPDRAAEKLGDGVELAAGDFSDTASLHHALEGADHLFLTSADGPQKVEHETTVIDAKAKAVWAAPTPKHPNPNMGRMSLRVSLLAGSRSLRTPSSMSPPPLNRNATIKS
jgi:uncharacterized protein YbjT (DUF2867 family)